MSDSTQIALIQLTQQQQGKDISSIAMDIKELKNTKYVTQNDLELKMASIQKEMAEQINLLIAKVQFQTKVGMVVGGGMLIITAILGLLVKGIRI